MKSIKIITLFSLLLLVSFQSCKKDHGIAPDLPPESANFFITEAGISDEEIIVYPNENKKKKSDNSRPKND